MVGFLLGFTGFYWVLLGFTEFYWVLLGFTGFYRVFSRFYWVLLGFTVEKMEIKKIRSGAGSLRCEEFLPIFFLVLKSKFNY